MKEIIEKIDFAIANNIDCIITVPEENALFGNTILTRCFIDDNISSITYKIKNIDLLNLKQNLEKENVHKPTKRKNAKSKD